MKIGNIIKKYLKFEGITDEEFIILIATDPSDIAFSVVSMIGHDYKICISIDNEQPTYIELSGLDINCEYFDELYDFFQIFTNSKIVTNYIKISNTNIQHWLAIFINNFTNFCNTYGVNRWTTLQRLQHEFIAKL